MKSAWAMSETVLSKSQPSVHMERGLARENTPAPGEAVFQNTLYIGEARSFCQGTAHSRCTPFPGRCWTLLHTLPKLASLCFCNYTNNFVPWNGTKQEFILSHTAEFQTSDCSYPISSAHSPQSFFIVIVSNPLYGSLESYSEGSYAQDRCCCNCTFISVRL